ncbi:tyrosine-type recombinase/integrase [Halobacillus mangrovi]|uniref:Integrase n=1 Tax=Halobacillus mangrovi TaxID=402384 RepID=A0A1W5ZY20_9BACI|nr:tyrosine-type recombinase/integrase [Halobacillus mangrovi]ARI78246.1 integrase [Halobacillus mangrovi]
MRRNRRDNRLSPYEIDIVERSLKGKEMPFDQALRKFLIDGERKALREFTLHYYQKECEDFRRYLVRMEKSLDLNLVVRTDIDNYIDDMKHERHLKVGTINTKLRAIRTLFNFLKDGKYIDKNPMKKYPLLKNRKANIETFNLTQLKQLLNAPDLRTFTGQRDYTYLLLLVETGLRLNEASGILVEDVKLSEGQIFVRNTKNHLHRYVPIQSKMKEQLKRYLRLRGTCETDHLFVTIDETRMTRNALQRIVAKHGAKAGIKGVRCSPHTLRHTFAKLSVMNGAGVFELQKILGHSSMEMVRVYVNLFGSEVAEKHKEFSPLKDLDV